MPDVIHRTAADLTAAATALIHAEARRLDHKQYAEWDQMWDTEDDTRYVLPIGRIETGFDDHLNLVNDDTAMRRRRVERLSGGYAHVANSTGVVIRVVGVAVVHQADDHSIALDSNEIVVAMKSGEQQVWAAEMRHEFVSRPDGLKLRQKVVWLADSDSSVRSCGFLL
jgi:3-phenylpropionate/cinnamic acid dioxygenase small subunit